MKHPFFKRTSSVERELSHGIVMVWPTPNLDQTSFEQLRATALTPFLFVVCGRAIP